MTLSTTNNAGDNSTECIFCHEKAPSIEWAAANAWAPSYFDGQDEIDGPICPDCQDQQLRMADDGCMVAQ